MDGGWRPSDSLIIFRESASSAPAGRARGDKKILQGDLVDGAPGGLVCFRCLTKGDEPLYQTVLRDSSLFSSLLQLDQVLADEARAAGCACGGALHSAHYPRKPRGGPEGLGAEHSMRLSFCCSRCRKRVTPGSLRFLGRKVFFGVWVLLLPVLRDGVTRERLRRLEEVFDVSRRTLLRWRRFWREALPDSRFWEARRGRFATPVAVEALPGSLLEAFTGAAPSGRVLEVLSFLSPLSCGCREQAF